MNSAHKILSSPFNNSSSKKKKMLDRFIPHSVSKNLYSLFDKDENIDRNYNGHK